MNGGFLSWWQHMPERIDPYILEVGSFRIGYYGLMYVLAFLTFYMLLRHRLKSERFDFKADILDDLLPWLIAGVIVGGRLGYVIFYQFEYYLSHPLEIFLPFEFTDGIRYTGIAGMSYHGGVAGVIVAGLWFARKRKVSFWGLADFACPAIPLGYTFGRIGNFINGELYGRPTALPWGMYFPHDRSGLLRHPSQLYEALFEGIALFALLWALRKKRPFKGFHLGLYLMGYGTVRFFIEFVREPDAHLGFILGPLSMGQALCLLMVAGGGAISMFKKD